jgi:hypothetical protein
LGSAWAGVAPAATGAKSRTENGIMQNSRATDAHKYSVYL